MAYRIANVGKTGILKVKKSNAEQLKYRPDLGDVDLDLSSELNTNTTGQFNTVTGGLLESCIVDLEPIQSGSGTPSPQNVRPITGHPSVEVDNPKKNLLNPNDLGHTIRNNATGQPDGTQNDITSNTTLIEVKPNTSYIFSYNGSDAVVRVFAYLANKSFRHTEVSNTYFTTTSDTKYIAFQSSTASGDLTKWQLEEGQTITAYEPFNGYTIPLGQTVYGGSLDVVSGSGSSGYGYAVLDGTENWQLAPQDNTAWFFYYPTGMKSGNITVKSSHFQSAKNVDNSCWGVYQQLHIRPNSTIAPSGQTAEGLAEFKAWLANNNVQVIYELTNASSVTCTPTQIETMIGQNNISVPLEGQSLDSLTYREMMAWDDVEKAMEPKADKSSIGTDESGRTTASRSYIQGEHFYKDGKFCTAIASIASGATLTLNTNYVEGTIADNIRYEENYVTIAQDISYSARNAFRFGRVVEIYISLTTPTLSLDTVLGVTPYKPTNDFAFLGIYDASRPYEMIGNVFVRKSTGQIVIAQGTSVPSNKNVFITGTYICQ